MAWLIAESGPLRGTRFPLPEGAVVAIGRDERCAVRLSDPMASRVHCLLREKEEAWEVVDRNSLNGLLVNDAPTPRAVLGAGDSIQVGDTRFSFVEEEEDPLVGRTLGGYHIEARLGAGAMGAVYRALQLSLDRVVAIKLLAPRFAGDAGFVARFLDEARAAAKLQHPNVVQVYDAREDGGLHFMAMEYLEGGSLAELIEKDGRLDPAQVMAIGIDAADALAFAERQHIVHRDIKPGNLLLDGDGRVKLADLGIAADLRELALGGKREVVGSPRWMAPEQARGEPVDHRADIYSLGATLYYALAGAFAYEAPSTKELLAKKLSEDPVPLQRRVPDAPPGLCALIHRMMARDRDARPATAVEVREILVAPPRKAAGGAKPVRRRAPPVRRAVRRTSPPPVFVAAVAGLVLLIAAVVVLKARRPSEDAGPAGGSGAEGTAASGRAEGGKALRGAPGAEADPAERERLVREAVEKAKRRFEEERGREEAAAASSEPGSAAPAARAEPAQPGPEVLDRIAKGSEAIERLLSEGKLAEAEAQLGRLAEGLPEAARSRLSALRGRIEAAQKAAQEARAAVARVVLPVRKTIASLDFDGAARLVDDAVSGVPDAGPIAAALRADVASSRAAWDLIVKTLGEWQSSKRSVENALLSWPLEDAHPTPKSLKVAEVDGDRIRIGTSARAKEAPERSVFSLTDETLLGIGENLEDAPRAAFREGLGVLLLLRRGPDRARKLLEDPGLLPARKLWHQKALADAAGLWIEEGIFRGEALRDAWSDDAAGPGAGAWLALAGEASELLIGLRARSGPAADLKRLRDLFLLARERSLADAPLESFFHAKKFRSPKKGIVELSYDFSDQEQLRDFVPVKGLGSAMAWVKARKLLKLSGEVRYLRGDPFVGRLAVEAVVPPDGFDPKSPNIDVAFWTREADAVTPLLDGRSIDPREWMDRPGKPGNDYVVFGIGFLFDVAGGDEGRGRDGLDRLIRGARSFLPVYLRQPATVILAGRRGEAILRDRRELVWEAATGDLGKGGVRYSIQLEPGALRWRLNQRAVPVEETLELDRVRKRPEEPGSLTFFTMGAEVSYSAIQVAGELDPQWVSSRCRQVAEEELARIDKAGTPADTEK